jgi:hypothetical protein
MNHTYQGLQKPKNITPYVEAKIDRRLSLVGRLDDSSRALLTNTPLNSVLPIWYGGPLPPHSFSLQPDL